MGLYKLPKYMCLTFFVYLLPLLLSAGPRPLLRDQGTNSSGGTNMVVAQFVKTANLILDHVQFSPEHRKLLTDALSTVQIDPVDILVDPFDQPIPDQDDTPAYATVGYIQLKNDQFAPGIMSMGLFNVSVIHELFRASGATTKNAKGETVSIDEGFRLTVTKYKINQLQLPGEIQMAGNREKPHVAKASSEPPENADTLTYTDYAQNRNGYWDTENVSARVNGECLKEYNHCKIVNLSWEEPLCAGYTNGRSYCEVYLSKGTFTVKAW